MNSGDICTFLADRRGLEHRGQDAEPALHEISPQIRGELRKVRPHHGAEIRRGRRARGAELGDPGLGGFGVVLPCQSAKAGRFDRLTGRGGGQEKARRRRSRPGDGIVRLASLQDSIVEHHVIGREPAARLQHAPDLAIEKRPVGDVHRHMLQQRGVEAFLLEGKLQRAGRPERHPQSLARARGQIACGLHEGLAEIDAGDPAAIARRQKARRPADARTNIQNRHLGGDSNELGKLGGRGQPSRVKLVQGGQLLRLQRPILRPEIGERRLQPLGQAGRAIMVTHAGERIGHGRVPPGFR